MPDMPMFSTSPAKRPRKDSLADTITAVGQSIASALNPEAGSSSDATTSAQQVYKFKKTIQLWNMRRVTPKCRKLIVSYWS